MDLFGGNSTNFYVQLGREKNDSSGENLLSLKSIRKRYEEISNSLLGDFSKNTDRKKIFENIIRLRIACANMISAARDTNNGKEKKPSEQYKKQEVEELARRYEEEAKQIYISTEEFRKKYPEKYNEYTYLKFDGVVDTEKVGPQYLQMLYQIADKLDRMIIYGDINKNDVMELTIIFYRMKESYKKLSDPVTKREIDEKLALKFNPDRSDLAKNENYAEIIYTPENAINPEGSRVPVFVGENSQSDKITVYRVGRIGYGMFRKQNGNTTYQNPNALEEYIVIKKYADPKLAEARKKEYKMEKLLLVGVIKRMQKYF